jgi:hypothetical protein
MYRKLVQPLALALVLVSGFYLFPTVAYSAPPQGTGFCQAQCNPNNPMCPLECLSQAGNQDWGGHRPPWWHDPRVQVNCGPCLRGQKLCWATGYPGKWPFPCDDSCRTPACQ